MYDNLWLIPFFPLVGSILNGLFGKRYFKSEKVIGVIGTLAVAGSYIFSLKYFFQLLADTEKVHEVVYGSWCPSSANNSARWSSARNSSMLPAAGAKPCCRNVVK
jgi:NADH:ubiquinone oxidoreductase subunit 5 (subunit L)/multisubunit Na+/H+ antiporter MnhA subunit